MLFEKLKKSISTNIDSDAPLLNYTKPVVVQKIGMNMIYDLLIYDRPAIYLGSFLRSKEVAKVNHTFVIELKPEKSDTPESGFELPENEIEKVGEEMYDGFLDYMSSFLTNKVDPSIVKECNSRKDDLTEELRELQEHLPNN